MVGTYLAMAEILQIIDPMHKAAIVLRVMSAMRWEKVNNDDNPLRWDYCGVADEWPTWARN